MKHCSHFGETVISLQIILQTFLIQSEYGNLMYMQRNIDWMTSLSEKLLFTMSIKLNDDLTSLFTFPVHEA